VINPISGIRGRIGGLVAVASAAVALFGAPAASAASPNVFATVSPSGGLIAGGTSSGGRAIGVDHLGTGRYDVVFAPGLKLQGCSYVASTENPSFPPSQALLVFTAGGHLIGTNDVYVEVKNQGGGLTDGAFDLVVECGNQGMLGAVVGYSANLVRASPGTTLTSLGFGRYDVTFPTSVAGCAYLSTVGDPGTGTVVSPAIVATASGPNPDTVYVETKNLGGGLSSGVPFHLAVICPSALATRFAVVNANGTIARSSGQIIAGNAGAGMYFTAPSASGSCATVVSRGSTNTDAPYDAATVDTIPNLLLPGGTIPTTFVMTRSLQFFGGAFTNEPFHMAIVC
jgi:hypothetical protein